MELCLCSIIAGVHGTERQSQLLENNVCYEITQSRFNKLLRQENNIQLIAGFLNIVQYTKHGF